MTIAVIYATLAVAKRKPDKNFFRTLATDIHLFVKYFLWSIFTDDNNVFNNNNNVFISSFVKIHINKCYKFKKYILFQ